jgi:fluoroacetyl-CoA thioesterase
VALHTGLRGEADLAIADADTALAMGSGDVPVLATPRLVALIEAAAVSAVASSLDPGQTTVGIAVEIDHLRASAVGARVHAEAVLVGVEGRILEFEVSARDERTQVARGRHRRAVVDRERFLQRASGR